MPSSYSNRLGTAPEEAVKAPCVVAAVTNITLSGEQTIGVTAVVAGDRVLVAGQTDPSENGIYDAAAGAWSRATDWNAPEDVISGQLVAVPLKLYQASFTGAYNPNITEVSFSELGISTGYTQQSFTATDGQTLFTLSNTYTRGIGALAVYINGVFQDPSAFTETSTTSFTLSEGVDAGDLVTTVISSFTTLADSISSSLVTYSPAGTGAVATNVQTKLREQLSVKDFGAQCDAVIDISGNLTGTDDSSAVQLALNAAVSQEIWVVTCPGSIRIDSQISIPDGVSFVGGGGFGGPVYRVGTGYERFDEGPVIYVNFGSGGTSASNAAVELNARSKISGFSFWYPSQDMNTSTPTQFPPAITISTTDQGMSIENINLGNAYIGIEALLNHSQLRIQNVVGFPIAHGIRIGSAGDNPNISLVHFHPFYAFRGTTAGANLPTWIGANGTALDLRRSSWGIFRDIFAYGYNYGIYATYAASAANVTAGGVQSGHFLNCSFDSCYYPVWFEHGAGAGNVHWGCHFDNCFLVANDVNDVTRTSPVAFTWDADRTAGAALNSFVWRDGKIHGSELHGMQITNAFNFVIDGYWQEFGTGGSGNGVELVNCDYGWVQVNMDGQARAGIRGVKLTSDNSNIHISGIFRDFASTVIEIANASNTAYTIDAGIKIDTTGTAILDSNGNAQYGTLSSGDTGGTGSAGSGNQYVELTINGATYRVLHDGTV